MDDPYLTELDKRIQRLFDETWADQEGKRSVLTGMKIARAIYLKQKEK